MPGSVFGLALQTSNFAALLAFLDSQGSTQVLSSPRIATLNNQKAVLKVGTDEFFVTNVTTVTTTTGTTTQQTPTMTVAPFFSGICSMSRRRSTRHQHHAAHPSLGQRA